MPFPFLRLPELIQFEVLSKLEPFDLFFFSFVSSKTKSIAKLSSTKVDLTWQLCSFDGHHNIILENEKKEKSEFVVACEMWSYGLPEARIHFDQEVVTVRRDGSRLLFGSDGMSKAERKRLFEKLNDHILDIFKIKHYHLNGNIFLFKEFVSKYTKKLASLAICDVHVRTELPKALEEFSVEELEIKSSWPLYLSRLESSAPVKVRVLKCVGLNWLAIWNLDCEKIVVNTVHSPNFEYFPRVSLEEVIKRWMAGSLNLKELMINDSCARREYQRLIMNGIQTERIDENSFRIRRADGITAIVAVMEDSFMMTVEE